MAAKDIDWLAFSNSVSCHPAVRILEGKEAEDMRAEIRRAFARIGHPLGEGIRD